MIDTDILTGNAFRQVCDDYIDETKTYIDVGKKPKVIFCFTDWIELFIDRVLPRIDYRFKLVTHNADRPINDRFIKLLNDERLIAWYGMNCHLTHDKLVPIPIGIANEKWPHGNKQDILDAIEQNILKQERVYCNFNPNTSHRRSNLLSILKQYDFIDIETKCLNFADYLKRLKSYKFVISPPGNSIDCHRIWESLYLNTVPIILKHVATNTFVQHLPIIELSSYEDIQYDDLCNRYKCLPTNHNWLKFSHYASLIKS